MLLCSDTANDTEIWIAYINKVTFNCFALYVYASECQSVWGVFYYKSAHVNSNFCWGSSLHILYSDESVTFVSVVEQKVCSFGTWLITHVICRSTVVCLYMESREPALEITLHIWSSTNKNNSVLASNVFSCYWNWRNTKLGPFSLSTAFSNSCNVLLRMCYMHWVYTGVS